MPAWHGYRLFGFAFAPLLLCCVEPTLHYCALAAAAVLVFVHLKLVHVVVVARSAAAGVRRHVSVVLANLAHDVEEGIVDINACPGGGLDELAAETACECGTLCTMLVFGSTVTRLVHGVAMVGRVACTWVDVSKCFETNLLCSLVSPAPNRTCCRRQ